MKPLLKKAFLSETLPGLFRIPQNAHLFSSTTANWELNWELLHGFSGCNKKKSNVEKLISTKGDCLTCLIPPSFTMSETRSGPHDSRLCARFKCLDYFQPSQPSFLCLVQQCIRVCVCVSNSSQCGSGLSQHRRYPQDQGQATRITSSYPATAAASQTTATKQKDSGGQGSVRLSLCLFYTLY